MDQAFYLVFNRDSKIIGVILYLLSYLEVQSEHCYTKALTQNIKQTQCKMKKIHNIWDLFNSEIVDSVQKVKKQLSMQ